MSYLKDREIWLSNVPTGNPPTGYFWKFIQNGKVVVRDSSGNNQIMVATSGSQAITGSLTVTGGITGTVSSASYVEYSNVANKPTLVSGSEQITYSGLTGIPSGIVSGSSQVTYSGLTGIPSGIVSGSAQVVDLGFATTGSNTFQANQVITGSLFITQNLVVAGSSSIQYISSSVLDIADNIITVNAFNPGVRFGGLAVIDSGSSPQVSGSLLFDSIKDQWIFVHQNQSVVTSSVVLMGPETYNDLGNESYISANRLPKGSGVEHLRDSNISDTGTVVSVNSNTQVTGSLTVAGAGSFSSTLATGGNITVTANSAAVRVTESGGADVRMVAGGSSGFFGTYSNHPLQFLTDSVTKLTLSSTGNLGLGVTPSAWISAYRAFNIGLRGFVYSRTDTQETAIGTNWYRDSNGSFLYTANGFASYQAQQDSVHYWFTAPSGTAGNAISFTQAMTLDASGRLGIGTTSPTNGLLVINSTAANGVRFALESSGTMNGIVALGSNAISGLSTTDMALWTRGVMAFETGASGEKMRITSGGNVGIGTTSPGSKLQVEGGEIRATTTNGGVALYRTGDTGEVAAYNWAGSAYLNLNLVGLFHTFSTSGTERMRITSGGNILINQTSALLGVSPTIEMSGVGTSTPTSQASYNVYAWHGTNSTWRGYLQFVKSRGSTIGSYTVVANGDDLGTIRWSGADGSGTVIGAEINAYVDGTPGVNDMPTRLAFLTTADGASSPTERMRITSAGRLLVNTVSESDAIFQVHNNSSNYAAYIFANTIYSGSYRIIRMFANGNNIMDISSSNGTDISFANGQNGFISFSTNGSPRMRITSGAQVLFGTTSGTGITTGTSANQGVGIGGGVLEIQTNNNSNIYLSKATGYSSGDFTAHFVNGNYVGGISTNGSATNYATASDYRLKQDLKDFDGITLINKIKTYDYEWKVDNTRMFGVIAHELQEVLPFAVTGEKDAERMQGVDYSKLIPVLVKALQEQQTLIESLKSRIEILEQ